jgi:hypothetical protein
MACRRCSTCGISYPTHVSECRVCEAKTDWIGDVEPDADWEQAVELRPVQTDASEQKVREWRHILLERLGFAGAYLELLVEQPTDLRLAEKLVGEGCPLDVAARILL